ncbi:hypothetical protein TTHERM_01081720 (macronuclear) [Tetrahymena thermophila SB210]|uniref:Transmembrane protein n=1 Tax=Tetrahymena thermophila (strain SB210) TaxID=312017 RepID=Q22BZ7_TETTS|nr:hypothetical protein TTHERM_01081720 [Tetrahymena thermophila SB210]EAR82812.1 hypothetical protein TTHERM_01081720 [Tetrahymena thermophila SB210]|eukprot:XP_001030475.1 hypothetical protein TTHERM_01081720 [Tetrahymena thermophila SB210]
MAIQIAVIIFFLILVKISCKCDQKLDCFDQRVSKCVQIDGVEFIGREMKNGYCVTDSIQYDKIDFCISKQENVCITQDRKSCVKIQKSKNIVAITEEGICIGIYENASQQSRPLRSINIKM